MNDSFVRFAPETSKEIARAVKEGKLVHLDRGIYSPTPEVDPLTLLLVRYPQAIVTLRTALSLYRLLDEQVEAPFDLTFQHGHRKIKNPSVCPFDGQNAYFGIGKVSLKRAETSIAIYDPERLLIEVFSHEKALGAPHYAEAIQHYRVYVAEGRFFYPRFESYCAQFKRGQGYLQRFQKEVE
jgi:hypothetical protein